MRHCSHVQNGKATPSEQRHGSKDRPKDGAVGQWVQFLAQWISIYKKLSGSFHVFSNET